MSIVVKKEITKQQIYKDNQKDWNYYMVELKINPRTDKITKISEYVSKDLKNWVLMGKPYTYIYLEESGYKGIKLEEVYNIMYNNTLKNLEIYDIIYKRVKN